MRLRCGPIIAELGHELHFAGYLRALARASGGITIISRPDRYALYADFCTTFIGHAFDAECSFFQPLPGSAIPASEVAALRKLEPGEKAVPPGRYVLGVQLEHRRYGHWRPEYDGLVVFHARNRPTSRERNWPMEKWAKLVEALPHGPAVSVGSREHALPIPGTEDLRGIPLAELMDVLASARLAIGPSSGPMHLASFCGCPQAVWCGGDEGEARETETRYRRLWNPHATPVAVLTRLDWQPCVSEVLGLGKEAGYG